MYSRKIAIFIPNLEGGGAERMMVNLANKFVDKTNVDLLLATESGPYIKIVDNKVNIINFGISFSNPTILIYLIKYIRKEKPIAILSAMTYPNVAILIARICSNVSTRLVISERVAMGIQSNNSFSLKEKLKPLAARLTYNSADHIIAISNGVADNLAETIKIPKNKITTIYNPVVTTSILIKRPRPNHAFFADKHNKVIVAAGRLVRQKDFGTLILAFNKLLSNQEMYLVILGEGPLRNELHKQIYKLGITKFVSLPGYTDNVFSYFQHASLFVLSSAWEGFGNVLVEAMACGCPVVSTNCESGPSEILENGKYGILTKPGDVGAMASAMQDTLSQPLSSNILRTRANAFRSDEIADKYLKILTNGA
ncbi:MAG: glycosyltransferase [Gammaproteobacteria bacterium]